MLKLGYSVLAQPLGAYPARPVKAQPQQGDTGMTTGKSRAGAYLMAKRRKPDRHAAAYGCEHVGVSGLNGSNIETLARLGLGQSHSTRTCPLRTDADRVWQPTPTRASGLYQDPRRSVGQQTTARWPIAECVQTFASIGFSPQSAVIPAKKRKDLFEVFPQ